jgi:VWFA-related protein
MVHARWSGVRVPVAIAAVIACVCVVLPAAQVVSQNQLPERQLPVFRADSHFVRVDAYPTNRDGSVIRGLTAADFQLTEDGTTQAIDSAEFIEYERWSPGSERPEPRDQRESFRLAADPRYRVVVVYLDRLKWHNAHYVRQPLIDLLTREIGPRDLFGILLPNHEASDLVLGRFTPGMQSMVSQFLQIQNHQEPFNLDPVETKLLTCFGQAGFGLIDNWRTDNLYRDLEGVITILGTIRDERKSLILVTERMPGVDAFSRRGGIPPAIGGSRPLPPPVRPMPGAGGLSTGIYQPDFNSAGACQMLASGIPEPHPQRFQDLIKLARRMNVAINPISPSGLTMRVNWDNSYLSQLASETGGLAIVNTNGIKEGFKRVANDMSAYYVLGYYTTNTKWDGRLRRLRVKLKGTGQTVRARYEYQAPTAEEIAAMRAAADAPPRPKGPTAEESAMNVLARVRADAELHVHGALHGQTLAIAVELPQGTASARWQQGGDVDVTATDPQGQSIEGRAKMAAGARGAEVRLLLPSGQHGPWQVRARLSQQDEALEDHARVASDAASVFGVPLLYRALPQPAAPFRPVADPQFWRTERMRAEWLLPGGGSPYTVRARLLQASGDPLGFAPPVTMEDTSEGVRVRLDLSLASFASADYLIEVTAERDGQESRTLQAIRILR